MSTAVSHQNEIHLNHFIGKLQFSYSGQWQFGARHGYGVEQTCTEDGVAITVRAGYWAHEVYMGPEAPVAKLSEPK